MYDCLGNSKPIAPLVLNNNSNMGLNASVLSEYEHKKGSQFISLILTNNNDVDELSEFVTISPISDRYTITNVAGQPGRCRVAIYDNAGHLMGIVFGWRV